MAAGKNLLCKGDSHRTFVVLRRTGQSQPRGRAFLFVSWGEATPPRKNLRGKQRQSSVSLKHSKREKEPWFIISSLPTDAYTPQQIITLYKKRMQIEEAFRDFKNTRNGFSL